MCSIIKMNLAFGRWYVPKIRHGQFLELMLTENHGKEIPTRSIGVTVEYTTGNIPRIRVVYPDARPDEMFYLYKPNGWDEDLLFSNLVLKLGAAVMVIEVTVKKNLFWKTKVLA